MATQLRTITTDDFEAFLALPENAERRFELVDGEIVEKMPTREHGVVALNIGTAFNLYLREHPIGVAAVEARHRPAGDAHNDRIPDVSVVLDPARPVERQGAADYLPDIAVEIQSPGDSWRALYEKALFYLEHGTRVVILVLTDPRQVEKLTAESRTLLGEDDTLDLNEVMPGFTLPVKDIFRGV